MKNYWLNGNDVSTGFATLVSGITLDWEPTPFSFSVPFIPTMEITFPAITLTLPEDFQIPPFAMTCRAVDYIEEGM